MSMFCYQCQEAAKGTGCSTAGVCGKNETNSNLQDLLLYVAKGVSVFSFELRKAKMPNRSAEKFITDSLFTTITNANFDEKVIIEKIHQGLRIRNILHDIARQNEIYSKFQDADVATWIELGDAELKSKAKKIGILSEDNQDIRSLTELLIYGIKGIAAYYEHANNLGFENHEIIDFIEKGLIESLNPQNTVDDLLALVIECGKYGVEVMALLDKANTTRFGHPEITEVNLGTRNNPAILISGHDLADLEQLLEQTQNTGVDVYTHSEMLPGHYYPAFKKFGNFVGNYGSSWWNQHEEFTSFNGPVIFTTNCIVPPKENSTFKDRVYTTGSAGCEGYKHIQTSEDGKKDFSAIIAQAKKCPPPTQIESGKIVGGFAHHQVLQLADKIVDAVKSGAVKKFVVMAGCDGRMKSREYYTEFAESLPADSIILTAGCAKYRYNKLNLGNIGGIPRVLDAGQCNDSYSLAVIALKLKEVFGLNDINALPIVYNIAWYEQKAVIVLLALLYLGVKNIHLGPTLPAFLSPNVAEILISKFGIGGISTVQNDIKIMIEN